MFFYVLPLRDVCFFLSLQIVANPHRWEANNSWCQIGLIVVVSPLSIILAEFPFIASVFKVL